MLECRFRQLVRACVSHAHNNEHASDPLKARFTRPIGCSQANHRVRTWPLLAAMSASGSAPAPCHSFNLEERCVAAGYDNGDIKLLDLRTNAVIRRAGPAQSHALLRRAASVERASSHVCLSAASGIHRIAMRILFTVAQPGAVRMEPLRHASSHIRAVRRMPL